MEIQSEIPKLKQSELAKQLGCSNSTLQRCRSDINMLSPYRFPPNTATKRKQKFSYREHDIERPQMTSNDRRRPQLT